MTNREIQGSPSRAAVMPIPTPTPIHLRPPIGRLRRIRRAHRIHIRARRSQRRYNRQHPIRMGAPEIIPCATAKNNGVHPQISGRPHPPRATTSHSPHPIRPHSRVMKRNPIHRQRLFTSTPLSSNHAATSDCFPFCRVIQRRPLQITPPSVRGPPLQYSSPPRSHATFRQLQKSAGSRNHQRGTMIIPARPIVMPQRVNIAPRRKCSQTFAKSFSIAAETNPASTAPASARSPKANPMDTTDPPATESPKTPRERSNQNPPKPRMISPSRPSRPQHPPHPRSSPTSPKHNAPPPVSP